MEKYSVEELKEIIRYCRANGVARFCVDAMGYRIDFIEARGFAGLPPYVAQEVQAAEDASPMVRPPLVSVPPAPPPPTPPSGDYVDATSDYKSRDPLLDLALHPPDDIRNPQDGPPET